MVICCIQRKDGGTYSTLQYSVKQGKGHKLVGEPTLTSVMGSKLIIESKKCGIYIYIV